MERNTKWDFYKGMLIWGVVIGHMITALKAGEDCYVWLHTFLRTYDMPMFAFISGYFICNGFERHSLKQGIMRRVKAILFPTVMWNIAINLITRNMSLYLWYLWSIFFCNIIVFSIAKISKNRVLMAVLFSFAVLIFHTGLGEKLNIGFLLFPCIVGFYYAFFEKKCISRMKFDILFGISTCIVVAFIVMLFFWKAEYSVWNIGTAAFKNYHTFLLILYRGILGVVGSMGMMILFSAIFNALKKINIICKCGQVTLEIYILQTIFVELIFGKVVLILVNALGYNPFIQSSSLLGFVIAPLISLVAIYVLYKAQYLLKKIPGIGKYVFRLG